MHSTTELQDTECCVCGVSFAVPKIMLDHRIKNGGYLHCPSGHSIGWGEGKIEKALRIAEETSEKQRKMIYEFSAQNSKLEASNRAFKAANTKLKNKKKKGK